MSNLDFYKKLIIKHIEQMPLEDFANLFLLFYSRGVQEAYSTEYLCIDGVDTESTICAYCFKKHEKEGTTPPCKRVPYDDTAPCMSELEFLKEEHE